MYLKKNAAEHNLDPNKIVVIGNSAGGHLVSLLGTRNGPTSRARVAAVINLFGAGILYDGGGIAISRLLGCPTPADHNTRCHKAAVDASPITHVDAKDPPVLFLHSKDDNTVPWQQSRDMHQAMKAAGVASEIRLYDTGGHGVDPKGANAMLEMIAFFRKRL